MMLLLLSLWIIKMKGMRIATTGVEHLGLGDDENDDLDLLDCGDNGEDVTDDESQMIVTNVDYLDCGDDDDTDEDVTDDDHNKC